MSSTYSFHLPHLCIVFSYFWSLYISYCIWDDFFLFIFYFSNSFFSMVNFAINLTNLIYTFNEFFLKFRSVWFFSCLLILFSKCPILSLWLWFLLLLPMSFKIYFKCISDVLLSLVIGELILLLLFPFLFYFILFFSFWLR